MSEPTAESLEVQCPSCGRRSVVPRSFAGRSGRCPGCREPIEVPREDPVPEPVEVPLPDTVEVPLPDTVEAPLEVTVSSDLSEAPSLSPTPSDSRDPRLHPRELRECPHCGEPIRAAAKKCRHCGEYLDAALRAKRRGAGPLSWALPGGVRVLLWLEGAALALCAIAELDRAEVPTYTGGAICAGASVVYALTSILNAYHAQRWALRALAGHGVLVIWAAVLAINVLRIHPSDSSAPLAAIGVFGALSAMALAVLGARRDAART